MIFIILAHDRPGMLQARIAHRQRHIDYWKGQPNVVKIAGAMLDDNEPAGSAFLLEADDETTARALIAADPFSIEGIFSPDIQVQQVRPAIGTWYPT